VKYLTHEKNETWKNIEQGPSDLKRAGKWDMENTWKSG
jgi:hypothetical protein